LPWKPKIEATKRRNPVLKELFQQPAKVVQEALVAFVASAGAVAPADIEADAP
jgi:hypothetical protein